MSVSVLGCVSSGNGHAGAVFDVFDVALARLFKIGPSDHAGVVVCEEDASVSASNGDITDDGTNIIGIILNDGIQCSKCH